MAATPAATRLITAAARQTLAPLGIRQKGRSRSWFDDHGWWLVLIEFQPSSSRVGTYLNVGAMWLWAETDHWTFDEGHRIHWRRDGTFFHSPPLGITGTTQYLDFTGEEQFARDVDLVVDVAARRTVQLRQQFTDPPAVARHLTTTTNPQINTPWRTYNLGVAAGLSGDTALARQAIAQTTAFTDDGGWAGELAQRAGKLADLLDDAQEFRNTIGDIIQATRQRLNLPPAGPTPWTRQIAGGTRRPDRAHHELRLEY